MSILYPLWETKKHETMKIFFSKSSFTFFVRKNCKKGFRNFSKVDISVFWDFFLTEQKTQYFKLAWFSSHLLVVE